MYRIVLFQIIAPSERVKYYAVWTLTEGASILTGFGFTGFNEAGKSTWNGAANVIPFDIEWPANFKGILDSWNMKTNVWLRECIYKRVTPKGKKPGFSSNLITSLTSAFWVSLHLISPALIKLTFHFSMGSSLDTTLRSSSVHLLPQLRA